jgi:phytoene/squalene synthetase
VIFLVNESTADLARSITWEGSKQAYFTGRLMIDRDLVDDFYRAYAYFRWVDDVIDNSAQTDRERIDFINRQRELIDGLYGNGRSNDLTSEEEMLADLIRHDRGEKSGLQSFIRKMFAIIEFDAYRKGWSIDQEELVWYASCLSKSVTDGIQYFIGNGHPYPDGDYRLSAGIGAHITHLLRDTVHDTADGFINIPAEILEAYAIRPDDVDSEPYRKWVRERVNEARQYLFEGTRYLDDLGVLRCKIAGHWYVARFEAILDTIELDDYHLRADYKERNRLSTWLRIIWLGVSITLKHIAGR